MTEEADLDQEVRYDRLAFELEQMQHLRQESSMFDFKANDPELPDCYLVEYRCLGLVGPNEPPVALHLVQIDLPAQYPRVPPVVRFKTPIFHPNIRAFIEENDEFDNLVRQVGGVENLERLYQQDPDIRDLLDAHVCLDTLKLNWSPAHNLYDICVELGAMIQYQRYNVNDPLNRKAAGWTIWAEKQRNRLPIDPRDLRDRLYIAPIPIKGSSRGIRILTVEKVKP
jgi:ubiquitin-protein ligase